MEQESAESQFVRLTETWEKLGQGERNVLMVFLYRLYAGQKVHGKLTRTKKDWTYEALEEAIDASVYLSCALEAKAGLAEQVAVKVAEEEASRPENWVRENLAEMAFTNGETTRVQEQESPDTIPDTERFCGAV